MGCIILSNLSQKILSNKLSLHERPQRFVLSCVLQAKPLLDANHIKDLVDPSLGDDYKREQMGCVVLTASMCIEHSPILRPRMSQASTQRTRLMHIISSFKLKLPSY